MVLDSISLIKPTYNSFLYISSIYRQQPVTNLLYVSIDIDIIYKINEYECFNLGYGFFLILGSYCIYKFSPELMQSSLRLRV